MVSKLRKLLDRLSQRDASLTEIVIAASCSQEDAKDTTEDDDDDIDIYPLLATNLPNNSTIQSISITERGPCDDDGIPSFAASLPTMSSLHSLTLQSVGLSPEDVEAISQVLPQIASLETLNLSSNGIDDDGVESLCSAIGQCKELQALELGGNAITDVGAQSISEILPNMAHQLLSFGVGNMLGKEGSKTICKAISTLSHLEILDLSGNKKNGADLANSIANIVLPSSVSTSLTCLKLDGAGIGPRGTRTLLSALSKHKVNLKELSLSGCRVGFFGTKAIGSIGLPPNLEILNIGNNAIGDDGAWQLTGALANLHRLTALDLSSNQLGDDAAAEIARMLPSLENLSSLDLSRNKEISDAGAEILAEALQSTPNLSEVMLTSNSIGNTGAAALGRTLGMDCCNLVKLDLGNNEIGDEGAIGLAEGLKSNTSLNYLGLKSNNIGDEGAGEFVEHLDANKTLLVLDLDGNSVSSSRTMLLVMLLKHRKPAKAKPDVPAQEATPVKLEAENPPLSPSTARTPVGSVTSGDKVEFDPDALAECRDRIEEATTSTNPPAKISSQFAAYCTNSFNPRNLLNYGSFGDLFEGTDAESGRRYAARRLLLGDPGVLKEMRSRVVDDLATLKQTAQLNILPLLAYSAENRDSEHDVYTFLYDLGPKSSLKELIADEDKRKAMPWSVRIKILKDIVAAVEFLHTGGGKEKRSRPSYHGDIKSSNIFVDDDFNAMLIDCGVSRLVATDRTIFQRGDVVFGTRGYRCPRYERGQKFTAQCDIFSLGLVIAEIIGGKLQNHIESSGKVHDYYYQYVLLKKITLDPFGGPISQEAAGAFCKLSIACMNSEPARRPSASILLKMLEQFSSGVAAGK